MTPFERDQGRAARVEEVRRAGRAVILVGLAFGIPIAGLWIWGQALGVSRRLDELEGFRAGIPATMLPQDRRFHEEPITYKGQKMTGRYYKSSASGTAAASDYFVIVNGEGIVEAAFSTDDPNGRKWYGRFQSAAGDSPN